MPGHPSCCPAGSGCLEVTFAGFPTDCEGCECMNRTFRLNFFQMSPTTCSSPGLVFPGAGYIPTGFTICKMKYDGWDHHTAPALIASLAKVDGDWILTVSLKSGGTYDLNTKVWTWTHNYGPISLDCSSCSQVILNLTAQPSTSWFDPSSVTVTAVCRSGACTDYVAPQCPLCTCGTFGSWLVQVNGIGISNPDPMPQCEARYPAAALNGIIAASFTNAFWVWNKRVCSGINYYGSAVRLSAECAGTPWNNVRLSGTRFTPFYTDDPCSNAGVFSIAPGTPPIDCGQEYTLNFEYQARDPAVSHYDFSNATAKLVM